MYIERVQIEEGFLSGLDVALSSGLNVVIGARGTGKTSLIELIRFCLDVGGNTSDAGRRSREHALSILGAGQVTVTLLSNGQRILVTRTASDGAPRSTGVYSKPIVFSQTEIETVGLEAAGRLRLIDSFISSVQREDAKEKQVVAEVASLTAEAATLRRDMEEIERQLKDLPSVDEELKSISAMEENVAKTSSVLQEKTVQLQAFSKHISAAAVAETKLDRAKNEFSTWYQQITQSQAFPLQDDSDKQGALHEFENEILHIRNHLTEAMNRVSGIWHALDERTKATNADRLAAESGARTLRQEVESLQVGAGQIMRKGQELREKKAKLESLVQLLLVKAAALDLIIKRRGVALDGLETLRSSRFQARGNVVDGLNRVLNPNIRINLMRNGQQSNYSATIADLLRGSGVRYGDVAPVLAARISPRVLLEAVDRFDVELISEAADISSDRASRVLAHLRTCDLGGLGTIDLEDEVSLQLLDGADYKDLAALSTGQRCTVVLPLVLAHQARVLIVDQPEDHIDNAFIASTLIKAVLARGSAGQILFSTHNPNIPVLGNASNVIQLGSDGTRGYVLAEGALNACHIVDAISTVMEGGAEAFSRRTSFYNQYAIL